MNYSNNPNQVVFLKDSDIVQDIAGKNISGNSVEINGIASYNLVSAISNDTHVAIDNIMSDILSVNDLISNGTTGLNTKIKFLSDTIDDPISSTLNSLNLSVQNNNTDIENIRKDIKGGVVYQGHLKLDTQTSVFALSDYVAFLYDENAQPHKDATLAKPLSNGWMYYIDFDPTNTGHAGITDVGSFQTNESDEENPHITFVPGNYIIVHTHNDDEYVVLSDLGRDQIDIIQVTDSDLVRFKDLNAVSNALCGSTTTLVNAINNTLVDAINTHIGEYSQLCTDLSTAIATVTNDVNTTISNAIDNKVQLSSFGDPDIQKIDTLVINKLPTAQYKALLNSGNVFDDQIYVISDNNQSLFGNSISDINDIQAVSGHIDNVSAGSLTVANEIQAAGLNVAGAGNVNVANVNASQQISVANDAFYAKQNGEVSAKNLTATTLSVTDNFTLKNGNYDGISAKSTNAGAGLTADGMISANQLFAKTTIVLNDKLTVDTNKTTAVALSTPALTANNITATSIATTDETAANLTATSLTATNEQITNDLSVSGKIVFGDNNSFNITKLNDALRINTTGATDPQLYINDKKFTEYFANYLSDGYIEKIDTYVSNEISGLRFVWNQDAPLSVGTFTENNKQITFIPLSALGGIYDQAGDIIKVIKNEANSFKISADASAISNAISAALSNAFELSNIKEAIANKVLLQEGTGPIQQLTSLNIKTLGADEYSALQPADDTIYVLTGNNMELFGNKIVGVGDPTENTDAANKQYVDGAINSLSIQNDGNAKKIYLKSGNTQLAEIDTSTFIKDGFLSSVTIGLDNNGKKALKFVWNTDAGIQKTDVLLTDIAKPYAGDNTYITITDDPNDSSQTISLNADAVSTSIKVAMYNEFESKITNNTTGTVYTKTQVNTISQNLSNTVANDYATKADYVSNNALSGANGILNNYCTTAYLNDPQTGAFNNYYNKTEVQGLSSNLTADANSKYVQKSDLSNGAGSFISTLMANYETAAIANNKYAPTGISSTIANTYVSATNFESFVTAATNGTGVFANYATTANYVLTSTFSTHVNHATNGTGIFDIYAKKADYVSNVDLNGPTGILTAYYTKTDLTGVEGTGANGIVYTRTQLTGSALVPRVLDTYYQLKDQMTSYYTAESANSTFATKEELSDYVARNELSTVAEKLTADIDELAANPLTSDIADKVNELVSAMNEIKNILSSIAAVS